MDRNENKTPLIGMTLSELKTLVESGGMKPFVARQIAEWIYKKRVTDFSEMRNISKKNQEWLKENYIIGRSKPSAVQQSTDGTRKYLFRIEGNRQIESVVIPDHDRATLCVSSQAGCRMNCYFCATGRNGFKRNLTANEILNQILELSGSGKADGRDNDLTNVVFMGMGEPLDNLDTLLKVIEIMTADWGMAWSPKRITVSTVGVIPKLKELIEKTNVHIAVSLHTPYPQEREQLMPAQKPYPIANVIKLLKGYDFSHQLRLSFEYIMWRGVNDDIAHAEALANLLKGLDCRVNLIRHHELPGVKLKSATEERMLMFRNYLNSKGIIATIRASRGEDIMAACGMLAGNNQ